MNYLRQSLESFHDMINWQDTNIRKILIDDYPLGRNDHEFEELKDRYNIDTMILHEENKGQSATWREAWDILPEDTDFIWHQEDDFIFPTELNGKALIKCMIMLAPQALQIALKRQQWYADENDFVCKINNGDSGEEHRITHEMGGIDDFFIFHEEYFVANPCIYPYWVTQEKYKHNPQESVIMNHFHMSTPKMSSVIYGRRQDPPRCIHIGDYNQGRKVLEGEPGWDWLKFYEVDKKYDSKGYLKEWKEDE